MFTAINQSKIIFIIANAQVLAPCFLDTVTWPQIGVSENCLGYVSAISPSNITLYPSKEGDGMSPFNLLLGNACNVSEL